MRTRPLYDVVALLTRFGVGVVFMAHGWQKVQVGITSTGQSFDAMGVPAAKAAAVYATFVELIGGAALIVGIGLPVAGVLLFLDMAGAFVFVHAEHGIFLVDNGAVHNGFELVLVLGLASLVFAAGGGGRISLDNRLFGRRASTAEPPRPAARRPGRHTDDDAQRWTAALAPETDEPGAAGSGPASAAWSVPSGRTEPIPVPSRPSAAETATDITDDTSRDVIVAGGDRDAKASSADTSQMKVPTEDEPKPKKGRGKSTRRSDHD